VREGKIVYQPPEKCYTRVSIEEGEEYADKIVESAEDLSKALKSKKKAELVVIAEEKGLATTGTKADLIERITSGEE